MLVAYCDLMRTPTKERLAASLARTIHEDIDSELGEAAERAASLFRNLRVKPTMEVDTNGTLSFSFQPTRRRTAIDDTIEDLLALPGQLAPSASAGSQSSSTSSRRSSRWIPSTRT